MSSENDRDDEDEYQCYSIGETVMEIEELSADDKVEIGSCFQRIMGSIKTGVILKDVSLTIQSGEVLAVLGSKGSGKRALLDVISRRVQGPTRGQILLNNVPMSLKLFQERCGYVTHKCDLIPGLTVQQTLHYTATKMTGYLKQSKVKQVMADLALTQVANRACDNITQSEYRRLMIGVQLIKDPVILLLDEPTWDLDPLNTYLVISILSNASKKYGAAVILTMEKPRSDVFPFLDRVLYLCLGDVVYTGGTKQMLEYFNHIGFPCPQLENPLMYYLCLSTVDRRSRERFVESNHQIAALVDKFKLEGGAYRKSTSALSGNTGDHAAILGHNKLPLAYSNPSGFQVAWNLYARLLAATFNFKKFGLKQLFLRLFAVPLVFLFLWSFYFNMANFQRTFITRSGLILNILIFIYFLGILNTIIIFPVYRTRYYQEAQEGIYRGPLFLLTYNLVSLPFSFISVAGGSAIIFPLLGDFKQPFDFLYFTLILWGCYIFAEQQTIAILMTVQNSLKAAICSIYISCVCIILSSGILRSIKGLQEWLYQLTYATQTRYAAAFLNRQVFLNPSLLTSLPYDMMHNCTNMNLIETANFNGATLPTNSFCRYANGQSYLTERYTREHNDLIFTEILDFDTNLGINFAFAIGMIIFNKLLYLIPLPTYVKAKFRE